MFRKGSRNYSLSSSAEFSLGVTVRALNLARVKMTSVMGELTGKMSLVTYGSAGQLLKTWWRQRRPIISANNLFIWREQVLFSHPQVPGTKGQNCEVGLSVFFTASPQEIIEHLVLPLEEHQVGSWSWAHCDTLFRQYGSRNKNDYRALRENCCFKERKSSGFCGHHTLDTRSCLFHLTFASILGPPTKLSWLKIDIFLFRSPDGCTLREV